MRKISFFLLALALATPGVAQEEPARGPYRAYEPASRAFRCDIPSKGWHPMEEETAQSYCVHILGPEDPTGSYRTGIDVHLFEPGQPGFIPVKKALDLMRREDKSSERSATSIRLLRNNGVLSRLFEVTETRRLPAESLPSASTVLHHYVAVIQSGESYFVLRLSSTREVYLDYREEFLRFLKNFRPLGYK
jgi:hypothetical protein